MAISKEDRESAHNQQPSKLNPVIIIGAGIVGLTLAHGLANVSLNHSTGSRLCPFQSSSAQQHGAQEDWNARDGADSADKDRERRQSISNHELNEDNNH